MHQHRFDLIETLAREHFVAVALPVERIPIGVRIEDTHHAGNARLVGPPTVIAGERYGSRSRAVVGAIASDDLVAAGESAGHLYGALVGLGAAEGEEKLVETL